MLGYLFGQKKAPERVVTDRVVPVGFFDNTILFRTFVMYTLFVFDDVLDTEKLRSSMESVISRPGWNKMGARLRRRVGRTHIDTLDRWTLGETDLLYSERWGF